MNIISSVKLFIGIFWNLILSLQSVSSDRPFSCISLKCQCSLQASFTGTGIELEVTHESRNGICGDYTNIKLLTDGLLLEFQVLESLLPL